jgi:hypothetical protein
MSAARTSAVLADNPYTRKPHRAGLSRMPRTVGRFTCSAGIASDALPVGTSLGLPGRNPVERLANAIALAQRLHGGGAVARSADGRELVQVSAAPSYPPLLNDERRRAEQYAVAQAA